MCGGISKTRSAFDAFRQFNPLKPMPIERKRHDDECIQMTDGDGLRYLENGPIPLDAELPFLQPPLIDDARADDVHLWVVRTEDVPFALEKNTFANAKIGLTQHKIKHSNLTGGGSAYCGGEILFLDENILVLSGRSGRYGPKSEAEMYSVAKAFRESGYYVLSMGWDGEAGVPAPFIGVAPKWVT